MPRLLQFALIVVVAAIAGACASSPRTREGLARTGHEIVVCGRLIPIGAPVVLWTDPGGYDAYSRQRRFVRPGQEGDEQPLPMRYGERPRPGAAPADASSGDARPPQAWTTAALAQVVDQFVIHYDVCGTSRQCFRILHDVRGLSVHFMLDIDGTIYQTLDVQERAWHATIANDRSVGIEIAHIGAYPPGRADTLDRWYARDERGWRITLPPEAGDGGVRTPGFVGRPARPGPIEGRINGELLVQHDFTPEQYESLARLVAGLNGALPRIALDAPRGADGRVLDRTLTPEEFGAFHGVLGHYHVQANKADAGPAFDWERVLGEARARRAGR